jgi:hypothetical protein
MSNAGGWWPFDVHDTGNTTPRATLQINTGRNSASCLLQPVTLGIEPGGHWTATYEDESLGLTFRGEGNTAMGAMLVLLAHRLGISAEDVIFNPQPVAFGSTDDR